MSAFGSDRLRERSTLATGVVVVAFLLLAGAFFRAQVLNYEDYRLQSEKNRLRQVPLMAPQILRHPVRSHSSQECSSYPYRRPEDLQKPSKALRPRSTCHPSERLAKIRLAIDLYSPYR